MLCPKSKSSVTESESFTAASYLPKARWPSFAHAAALPIWKIFLSASWEKASEPAQHRDRVPQGNDGLAARSPDNCLDGCSADSGLSATDRRHGCSWRENDGPRGERNSEGDDSRR